MIISFPQKYKYNLTWKQTNKNYSQYLKHTTVPDNNFKIIFNQLPYSGTKNTFIIYWYNNQKPLVSLITKEKKTQLFINSQNHQVININYFFIRKNKITQTFTQTINTTYIPINTNIQIINKTSNQNTYRQKQKQKQNYLQPKSGYIEDGIVENSGLPYQHKVQMPLPIGF